MDITEPRPKKFCRDYSDAPFPVVIQSKDIANRFMGCFNGFSVTLLQFKDMRYIISKGSFGKGMFSRSVPQFSDNIIRMRQYLRRAQWSELPRLKKSEKSRNIVTVPDSDGEYEDYFKDLMPISRTDKSGMKEVVCMGLEEAFFLFQYIKVLKIEIKFMLLDADEIWEKFILADPYFPYNYAAYHYFRSKNWVVKPGIKFGADFLLYKQGPSCYHASYVVIIDILNRNHERIQEFSRRSMDNISLLCLNRLCETARKELMICQLIINENRVLSYHNLQNIKIKEILMSRCTTFE